MPEDLCGLSRDMETYSMAVAGSAAHTAKQIEDSRHLVDRNADTGVVDFDPHGVAGATTSDEDATSRICVFYRITNQIS